ncbi:MAG TPA: hypothetical protein VLT79_01000 [Gemmatimonadales bacterium]|nr:hypothetical protein [Gemmatimonadales bacterium]
MQTLDKSIRFVGIALTLGVLGGCHTMRPLDKEQLSATPDLAQVWVTRRDRSTVIVEKPEVVGDTLDGLVQGREERIPLDDVAKMQTRVSDPGRTRNLALGIAAVGAIGVVALLNSNNANKPQQGLCYVAADQPPINCCLVDVSNGQNPPNC